MNIYKMPLILDAADPRLHQKCKAVKPEHVQDQLLLVQQMIKLQKAANGIGLAANQLGVMRRVITVGNEQTGEIFEFINPRIIGAEQTNENVYWDVEGCLSHPGVRGEVARYKSIEFAAYRLRTGKKENRFTCSGLMARIIQHEIDHLNGLLYLDLGSEVRNITMDLPGQEVLIQAGIKSMEEGYADGID